MKTLPGDATDDQIIEFVTQWVELLADERYAEALALVAPAPDPAYRLTPEQLETLIRNYGSFEPMADGSTFRVTSPSEAQGKQYVDGVHRFDEPRVADGAIGHLDYDLPLNGEWSDLTAQFSLVPDGDRLLVVFEQLDVM